MNILIIDNYDSFTYNLYQYIGEVLSTMHIEFELVVKRNDAITIQEIRNHSFDRIVISPGPGDPSDKAYFGVCIGVLLEIGKNTPVLGVCLGMQGMARYFGGKVVKAVRPMHGKTSMITHDGSRIFKNIPQRIEVMRYHSLVADRDSIPDCLKITATSCDTGEIMGLRHRNLPIEGIQFHPESIFTEGGKVMLENYLFNK